MKKRLAIIALLGACSSSGHGSNTGDVVGSGAVTPAASGDVVVVWVSDGGTGDYAYKYGEGTSSGATYSVAFDEPVPTAATFSGAFGVGQAFLVSSSLNLPDGIITDENGFQAAVLGVSGEYGFIFKGTATGADVPWLDAFPMGVSCGKCVHADTGFDSFEPVSCDAMELQTGDPNAIVVCNWT